MALSIEECLKNMEKFAEKFYEKRDTHSFEDILNLYIFDFNKYIKALSMCTCCERHQQNRPTHLVNPHEQQEMVYNTCVDKNECTCTCRHYIRILCRANYEKPNKLEKSSSSSGGAGCCFRSQCEFRCNCK